jgi:peroxiredoxin Q/BCP
VLGVSSDSEKSHRNFIAKQNLPFRLLSDEEKALHDKYGTWIEKSMYGRKYMGTARVTFIINEKGVIEEIFQKVDTKNHTDQILNPAGESSIAQKPKKPATKKSAQSKKAIKKKK